MISRTILTMIAAVALVSLVPAASANDYEVGLSGQCYNEDASSGGQDELRVGDQEVVVLDGVGTAEALAEFGLGTVEDNGNTGSACDRYDCYSNCAAQGKSQRSDYLEAHVKAGGTFVQVCYDGAPSTAGTCPTSPTGPGQ